MRIVFISKHSPPSYSGAGLATFRLAKRLNARGHDVQILAGLNDPQLPRNEMLDGVQIHRLTLLRSRVPFISDLTFDLGCMYWLFRHQNHYDIIQHASLPLWLPLFLSTALNHVPAFLRTSLFGSDDLYSISKRRFVGRLHLRLVERIEGILAISKKILQVSRLCVEDPDLIIYLPNSVDPIVFYPANHAGQRRSLRTKLGLPAAGQIVLFSGAIVRRKGIDLLVDAWELVSKDCPQATLCLVGPMVVGKQESYRKDNSTFVREIKGKINQAGIGESIIFAGEQSEAVPDYLRASDLLVLPSRREGLPNAVLEAMATGIPVVVCDYPWVPEDFVKQGEVGFVAEPNPPALADAISTILADEKLAADMGRSARQEALTNYHPDKLTDELLELYGRHLGEHPRGR